MRSFVLMDAITRMDHDLLEDYWRERARLAHRRQTSRVWMKFGALAAGLVLVVGIGLRGLGSKSQGEGNSGFNGDGCGVIDTEVMPDGDASDVTTHEEDAPPTSEAE